MMISKILLVCLAAFIVVQAASRKGRIVGGQKTNPGQHPYQVSIQRRIFVFWHIHAWGGAIISPRWVLTAAHCVYGLHVSVIRIKAGVHDVYDAGQDVNVKRVIIHSDYLGPEQEPYDLALLKLVTDLQFNALVAAVELPEHDAVPEGKGTLTGWGSKSTTFIPIYPDALMFVDLDIMTYNKCLKALNNTGESLEDYNLCTAPLTGGKVSCTGDSGGPLVAKGGKTLIGIDSWTIRTCGYKGTPSVFTRVSAFIGWINKKMK